MTRLRAETQYIDHLYLELSQFTTATTAKEITLRDKVSALRDLIRDVALSGVELDDTRLRYVTVQISRETWQQVAAVLAARPQEPTP